MVAVFRSPGIYFRAEENYLLYCPWSYGLQPEKLHARWKCRQQLSGFLASVHLLRLSRQSHLSSNDKGDNEVKTGPVDRSISK